MTFQNDKLTTLTSIEESLSDTDSDFYIYTHLLLLISNKQYEEALLYVKDKQRNNVLEDYYAILQERVELDKEDGENAITKDSGEDTEGDDFGDGSESDLSEEDSGDSSDTDESSEADTSFSEDENANMDDSTASWHYDYKNSAYIYIGGLPFHLTEGDLIVVFSEWGEIVDINLVRDQQTGKSKGFCFIAYEDQRSTILAVDNMNGTTLVGRTLKVDHVKDYRGQSIPKNETEEQRAIRVKNDRIRRLKILPSHLMTSDELLEAKREGINIQYSNQPSTIQPSSSNQNVSNELDDEDPMKEYLEKKHKKHKKKHKKLKPDRD